MKDRLLTTTIEPSRAAASWKDSIRAAFLPFLISRLVIVASAWLGYRFFSGWQSGAAVIRPEFVMYGDAGWYREITEEGYRFSQSVRTNAAFFPLFPLLSKILMHFGLSFSWSGTLINNFSALIAGAAVYRWASLRKSTALGSVIIWVFFLAPPSLFGAIAYSEGSFLCLSALVILFLEERRLLAVALCASLVAITRPTGVLLTAIASVEIIRLKKGRSLPLLAVCWSSFLAYLSFQYLNWGTPIAVVEQQALWRAQSKIPLLDLWGGLLARAITGTNDWKSNPGAYPLHIAVLCLSAIVCACIGRIRNWVGRPVAEVLLFASLVAGFVEGGDNLLHLIMPVGFALLAWRMRTALGRANYLFGLLSILTLVLSHSTQAADRIVWGTITFSVALGIALSNNPLWFRPVIAAQIFGLIAYTIRATQSNWFS